MHKKKVLQGSASNIVRLLLSTLVALVLPPFLVHRLSAAEYSAWVLILQVSAYVNFLELGLQTAIGKFVAEYDAANDRESNHRLVSTSFTILALAAVMGSVVIGVIAWARAPAFSPDAGSFGAGTSSWYFGRWVVHCAIPAFWRLPFHFYRSAAVWFSLRRWPWLPESHPRPH